MSNLDELKKELRKFAQWYSSQEHKLLMSEYNYAYQEEKALKSISQYLEQETLKARIDEHEQFRKAAAQYAHEHVEEMRTPDEMEALYHDASKKLSKLWSKAKEIRSIQLTNKSKEK